MSLINKPFLIHFFERPEYAFNIRILISDIRVVHIHPVSYLASKVFPHRLIFPNRLTTKVNKLLNAIIFNIFFAVETKFFFHLNLDRKAVCIPTCLTKDVISLHCLEAWNNIFHCTSKHMTNMRFAICSWRSIMQNKTFVRIFILMKSLFDNAVLFPKGKYFFFIFQKIKFAVNFLIHFFLLL